MAYKKFIIALSRISDFPAIQPKAFSQQASVSGFKSIIIQNDAETE